MNGVLLRLGVFTFKVSGPSYEGFEHTSSARWAKLDRLGAKPARQFVGPGDETIYLDGTIYPRFFGGFGQIEAMRAAAGLGQPMMLVSGYGRVFGMFVIERVASSQSYFLPDGSPQKAVFSLELAAYGGGADILGGLF